MLHNSLGIEIGRRSVRYAICEVDGENVGVLDAGTILIDTSHDADASSRDGYAFIHLNGVKAALGDLAGRVRSHRKKIEAIGFSLNPTLAFSADRSLPFSDPHQIEQILPQQIAEVFPMTDGNSQLAFEIHRGAELNNIHIIHYPKSELVEIIETTKIAGLEPHLMIPSTDAWSGAIKALASAGSSSPWILLDIGEDVSSLLVVSENQVKLARSFKLGSSSIDGALAQMLSISTDEAKALKERSGFVSPSGEEFQNCQRLLSSKTIEPTEIDPVKMSQACAQGLNDLISIIRRTLISFVTETRIEPQILYLTGGGSKLPGIEKWLSVVLDIRCNKEPPVSANGLNQYASSLNSLDPLAVAVVAAHNVDSKCPLNLRRGELSHKGSLVYVQENKWTFVALFVAIIASLVFMMVTSYKQAQKEHDKVKTTLEQATQDLFGKKLVKTSQIQSEIANSQGFNFVPEKTAFDHFAWLSSQVNDNLSDVEMDLSYIDIDILRKIVRIKGEVSGDDGLPKFLQLLEQYECFPDEIPEPGTTKNKDRASFNLSISTICATGDYSE